MAPAPAGEVDDGGKKSVLFRWLYTARKVVACAVVLLIIAVSVYAIVVVTRDEDLAVGVVGGTVFLRRSNSGVLGLDFTIAFDNNGGRAIIYYTNVTAVLVKRRRNTSAAAPANNTIMDLPLGDIIVEPNWQIDFDGFAGLDNNSPNSNTTTPYAKRFFRNRSRIIHGAELILHGNLTTTLYALYNRTSSPTNYTCSIVTVGGDYSYDDDVKCQKSAAAAAKLCSGVFMVIITMFLVIITLVTSG